ncbi:XRE family transcriptional regulator [Parablautia intestinalis]|uniref:XRE family transcriptional regulator n=1 Tax=Parablautia intestinalis TaxID=2320100 RepID=A0A3A9AGK3_9FIRM|nr:helix-turn-helix transcriptional regulator [Parablautia intestinalis]RKI90479.1 XRE family transcriptional regulator [Parablautia intestinalis]
MTLKQLRENKGMSQTELANCVGVKQTTISQYENGSRKPNLSKAKKISDALGISLDDFFCLATFQNEI